MMKSFLWLFSIVLSVGPLAAQTNFSAAVLSPLDRMKAAHLKSSHEAALHFQQVRRTIPSWPGLHDYKAILHAHAEDSAHTGGTRPEMLADAKKAGVQVILLTDHLRPPRDFMDSWRGLHEGVLFVPGSEARGFLVYPVDSIMKHMEAPAPELVPIVTRDEGLIFLSHIEERKDHSMEGLTGLEICNRHFDAKKDMAGLIALAMKLLDPAQLSELQENVRSYPDEALAAQVNYPTEYMAKWDAGTQTRRLTGVAANDCHHNQILTLKMVDEDTVLLGTNVDKDEGMRKFTAKSHSGISELTKDRKPGDVLAQVDFDPYYRSFRNMATHILATELTEKAIRAALKNGHAFVSHDWMCDATGFQFSLGKKPSTQIVMGDETKFEDGQQLRAQFPVTCHIRLLQNGIVVHESDNEDLEYRVTSPGVYRVEGWLKMDGEHRPWIYSNPIYVR